MNISKVYEKHCKCALFHSHHIPILLNSSYSLPLPSLVLHFDFSHLWFCTLVQLVYSTSLQGH